LNGNDHELLAALREQRRRQQGKIHGRLVVECAASSCPVSLITMTVNEAAGGRLLQPKLKCPRCSQEAWFVRLE